MRCHCVLLAALVACLPVLAGDDARHACPLCQGESASFENTPEGVYSKFQAAFIAGDVEWAKECVTSGKESTWQEFGGVQSSLGLGLLPRMRVIGCKTDGDRAALTVGYLGEKPVIDLDARRVNGVWRLDFGGDDWREPLTIKLISSFAPAAAKALERTRMKANGTTARAGLRIIVSTEDVWKLTDSDRNGVQDFWTLDVAAFHAMKDSEGAELGFIDVSLARADRLGWSAYVKDAPAPKSGYWFRALVTDETGAPYAADGDGDGKACTNPAKFAFCAYPAEYGKTGTLTYIIDETGVPYEKDLGAEAREGIDRWPGEDPESAGWKACE